MDEKTIERALLPLMLFKAHIDGKLDTKMIGGRRWFSVKEDYTEQDLEIATEVFEELMVSINRVIDDTNTDNYIR